MQIYIFPLKPQKKSPKNLQKREIFLIFAADLKHNLFEYTNKKQTLRNVLSSPLDDIVYTVDIDEESNHHNFQAHSIEDLPEDYLPTEDSYYEFEPEDVNKENLSIAEMSGKKLDWFRKVCAAVL